MTAGGGIAKPPVHLISLAQLVILVGACSLLGMVDQVFALSALCGGLIAVLPQAYFAARALRQLGARSALAMARDSYTGEVAKFMLSVVGFAAVFILLRPVSGVAVFAGYLGMLAVQIIGSWWLLRRPAT